MMNEKYNGWANRETWLADLWFTNDQGTFEYWVDRANELAIGDGYSKEETIYSLSVEMQETVETEAIETGEQFGLIRDLLDSAVSKIDWYELAESIYEYVDDSVYAYVEG